MSIRQGNNIIAGNPSLTSVVTTDTAQTVTGAKTFTGTMNIPTSSDDVATSLESVNVKYLYDNGYSDARLSHSSANKSLTNSPYTTNRILEIPQDIKIELNNGTLTLKAGSKVYIPNGFEQDGTTPKFDVVTISSDISKTAAFNTQHTMMHQPSTNEFALFVQGANLFSGTTDPTGVPTISCNYNTTLNKMRFTENGGSSWNDVDYSLPFAISTSNSSQYTSIDQIFNGFGFVGSTVFILPGIKVQIPDGKNEDGTFKYIFFTKTNVEIQTLSVSDTAWLDVFISPTQTYCLRDLGKIVYDSDANLNIDSVEDYRFIIGQAFFQTGKFTKIIPCAVDAVANSNASNFSQAGRSYLSGLGMPSSRYIDLALGASGSSYRAPANGWVTLSKEANSSSSSTRRYVYAQNYNSSKMDFISYGVSTEDVIITFPVYKGEVFTVYYTATGATKDFSFIYAEGEN